MTDLDSERARTQRLIQLADQVATEPDPPERKRALPLMTLAAGAVVAAALSFVLVVALTGGDDEAPRADATSATAASGPTPDATIGSPADTAPATNPPAAGATGATTPSSTAPATTTPASTSPATTGPATTLAAAPATTAPSATATTIAAVAPTPVAAGASADPVRFAEFSGGIVYLQGTVPDQATADEIRTKAAAVVGDGNVVVEYDIVPGAPRPESAPLYVRDSVLFARNSVDINSAARGVLDLGVVLMAQNPQITIDIQGHTDADGAEAANQALSQRRVDVIFAYLVAQGVDPARLTTAAFGETRPIADNATADGRAKNRRVEFTINDLLG